MQPLHVAIGSTRIGPTYPTYIIAEAGVNHDGTLDKALELVDVAAAAGADAVKFQHFSAARLAAADAPKAGYQEQTTGRDGTQASMLRALELTAEEQATVSDYCADVGIDYLCTPYDVEAAQDLLDIGVPAIKISSADLTNLPLLRFVAATELPAIISTGMSRLGDVENALEVLGGRRAAERTIILHCISEYPTAVTDANLNVLRTLAAATRCVVGYSDHTLGILAPVLAVALGACVIEKHFTLDVNAEGPDHRASLDPAGLRTMIDDIRAAEASFGDGVRRVTQTEEANAAAMRRGVVTAHSLRQGDVLQASDLRLQRPEGEITPRDLERVIGCSLTQDLAEGAPLRWHHLDRGSS